MGELNIRKTELNVKKNIPTEKYTIDDYRLESSMPCQKGDSLLSGRAKRLQKLNLTPAEGQVILKLC